MSVDSKISDMLSQFLSGAVALGVCLAFAGCKESDPEANPDPIRMGDSLVRFRYPALERVLARHQAKVVVRRWSEDSSPVFFLSLDSTPRLRELEAFDRLAVEMLDSLQRVDFHLAVIDTSSNARVEFWTRSELPPIIDYGDSLGPFKKPLQATFKNGEARVSRSLQKIMDRIAGGDPQYTVNCFAATDINGSLFLAIDGLYDMGTMSGPKPVQATLVDMKTGIEYARLDQHTLIDLKTARRIHHGYDSSELSWKTVGFRCDDPSTAHVWQLHGPTGRLQMLDIDTRKPLVELRIDSLGIPGRLLSAEASGWTGNDPVQARFIVSDTDGMRVYETEPGGRVAVRRAAIEPKPGYTGKWSLGIPDLYFGMGYTIIRTEDPFEKIDEGIGPWESLPGNNSVRDSALGDKEEGAENKMPREENEVPLQKNQSQGSDS